MPKESQQIADLSEILLAASCQQAWRGVHKDKYLFGEAFLFSCNSPKNSWSQDSLSIGSLKTFQINASSDLKIDRLPLVRMKQIAEDMVEEPESQAST